MKKGVLLLAAAVILIGCDEPLETIPNKNLRISAWQHDADFLFSGLPVFFALQTGSTAPSSEVVSDIESWNFGDGEKSAEPTVYHTFHFPGKYRVSVISNDGKGYKDTTLQISPRFSVIGSKNTPENGKFLFEHPTTGYSVIHTANGSSNGWMLLSTSSEFDSLKSRRLPFDDFYAEANAGLINKHGNIVIVNQAFWELDHSGTVLKKVYKEPAWTPLAIIEVENGYQMAGFLFDGKLRVVRFNDSFERLSQVELDITRSGYYPVQVYLDSEDVLRIHYRFEIGGANSPTMVVKRTVAGEILFEQDYNGDHPFGQSFKLTSGYLFAGIRSIDYTGFERFVFSKTDDTGRIQWTLESPLESMYPQYVHSGKMSVFEDDGFIYIFFDNQKGLKVSADGQITWSKRFGIGADTFNAALIKKSGNLVLLGSHQFNYKLFDYTTDYGMRDLSLIEIDKDGNLVSF